MQTFAADDGVLLSYHVTGTGPPLVCIAGGPMRNSAYLEGLVALAGPRQVIRLDLRGTGSSAEPSDESSYRCDHLVRDVEALRKRLGVEKISLLGHSAGTNLALLYLTHHPDRVDELTLVAPSLTAVGVDVPAEMRIAVARMRADQPWFPAAFEALEAVTSGRGNSATWEALAPFGYGRWDDVAQSHHAAEAVGTNDRAAAIYGAEGAFDPAKTRAQMQQFAGPVTVVAGELDLNSPLPAVRELAATFPDARLEVIPGAAHFPWLDEPTLVAAAMRQ
jgi:proline iminopeptidase